MLSLRCLNRALTEGLPSASDSGRVPKTKESYSPRAEPASCLGTFLWVPNTHSPHGEHLLLESIASRGQGITFR